MIYIVWHTKFLNPFDIKHFPIKECKQSLDIAIDNLQTIYKSFLKCWD